MRSLPLALIVMPTLAFAQGSTSTLQLPPATTVAPSDAVQVTQNGTTKRATVAAVVGGVAPLLSNNLADLPSVPAAVANLGLNTWIAATQAQAQQIANETTRARAAEAAISGGTATPGATTPITFAPQPFIANGTTQATASQIVYGDTTVTSAVASGGVILTAVVGQPTLTIHNATGAPLLVWPPGGLQINTLSPNAPATIVTYGSASFRLNGSNPVQGF